MCLFEILENLDKKKIRYIYKMLKASNDPKSKKVILDLFCGKTIFEALKPHCDKSCQLILENENNYSIILVGKYIKIKRKTFAKVYRSLGYPIFLLICSFISSFSVCFLISITLYEIFLVPILIVISSSYTIYKIFKELRFILQTYLFLEFLDNKISFFDLSVIFRQMRTEIHSKNLDNIKNISNAFLGKSFETKEDINNLYTGKLENFDKFCDRLIFINGNLSLSFVGIFVGYMIIKSLNIIFFKYI